MSRSRDTKEGRERAEYKRQQEKNIYAKAAAQRSAELEAIRKRTEELRELSWHKKSAVAFGRR